MNEEFARCTLEALRKTLSELDAEGKDNVAPVVWIHDYQLFTAATTVRQVHLLQIYSHYCRILKKL